MGVTLSPILPYTPHLIGSLERSHRTLGASIRQYCAADPQSWPEALQYVVYAFNTFSGPRGFSPFQLFFGRQPRFPGLADPRLFEVPEFLRDPFALSFEEHFKNAYEVQLRVWEQQNCHSNVGRPQDRVVHFPVGQEVLLRRVNFPRDVARKQVPLFHQRSKVTQVFSDLFVEIEDCISKQRQIVHVGRLKKVESPHSLHEAVEIVPGELLDEALLPQPMPRRTRAQMRRCREQE